MLIETRSATVKPCSYSCGRLLQKTRQFTTGVVLRAYLHEHKGAHTRSILCGNKMRFFSSENFFKAFPYQKSFFGAPRRDLCKRLFFSGCLLNEIGGGGGY